MPDALGGIGLQIGLFRFTIAPLQPLAVPAINKGNMLRGGFGHAFRRLCCVPQCRDTKKCPLATSCPYKAVFEPSPPPGADRLSKNQDIPRPFVFRAPQTDQTRFEKSEPFEFGLVLIGRALDFLPYFVLSFRELAGEGLGLNRAKCALEKVEEIRLSSDGTGGVKESELTLPSPPWGRGAAGEGVLSKTECCNTPGDYKPKLVYSAEDQLFRATVSSTADEWIKNRVRQLTSGPQALAPDTRNPAPDLLPSSPAPGTRNPAPDFLTIRFLTPTFLRANGEVVRRPEFHHLFKRLRDRINALSTFFGAGPLDVDFRGLGERAEKVRTVSIQTDWVERFRTSSKTRQRHELSGFVGEASYEGELSEFVPWLALGELVHVGKHTAWGNGRYDAVRVE